MAEGNEVIEGCLSCDDLSYDKRNLSGTNSENDIYNGSDGREDSDDSTDALGMEPYQFELVGNIGSSEDESNSEEDEEQAEWRLNNTNWCSNEVRVSFACILCALNAILKYIAMCSCVGVNAGIVK